MPLTRKPAISERIVGDRAIQGVVSNIRQRIEAIETALNTVESQAGQNTYLLGQRSAALSTLQSQLNALLDDIEAISDLLAGQEDGLVVLSSGALITRSLEAGDNITIDNPDGVDGNPVINSSGGGYPFITNELDDDVTTESGHRIRVED